jgi:iodotyrosine deiodinase
MASCAPVGSRRSSVLFASPSGSTNPLQVANPPHKPDLPWSVLKLQADSIWCGYHIVLEDKFEPLRFERLTPEEQLCASRDFVDRMARRRTVRSFSADPVPFTLIEDAIRCASLAPSGANQQPWRFVVVGDPEIKRQIRLAAETEERENYDHRFPDEWLEALRALGTDWHKEFLETAPYLIVVFRIDYGLDGSRKIKHYYVQESVGIAVGFLLASLHVAGLATLTHTPSPMGFLQKILNRPVNERPFVLIPVGYPAPDAEVPSLTKKSLDDVMVRL